MSSYEEHKAEFEARQTAKWAKEKERHKKRNHSYYERVTKLRRRGLLPIAVHAMVTEGEGVYERPVVRPDESWDAYQKRLTRWRTTRQALGLMRPAGKGSRGPYKPRATSKVKIIETHTILDVLNAIADTGTRSWKQGENNIKIKPWTPVRRCLRLGYLERRYAWDRRIWLSNGGIRMLREMGRTDVEYWGRAGIAAEVTPADTPY